MERQKFHVARSGKKPTIYDTWANCRGQIIETDDPKFKMFTNGNMAEKVFGEGPWKYFKKRGERKQRQLEPNRPPTMNSVAVGGTFDPNTREIKYRAVDLDTGEIVLEGGPFKDGTNNIAEFLAVVEALIYCAENQLDVPIYTDSVTAMSWLRDKTVRTKCLLGSELSFVVWDAIEWLNRHNWDTEILKWHTNIWGENPANFTGSDHSSECNR